MQLIYNGDTHTLDALEHHGVLGQKWGIRRYQPYPKGHKGGKEVGKAAERMSDDAKRASEIRKKKVNEMSNAELRTLNERDNLERNHRQLNPNVYKKGLAVAGAIAGGMGTFLALYNNGGRIVDIGKKTVKNLKPKISKMSLKAMDAVDARKAKKLGWY